MGGLLLARGAGADAPEPPRPDPVQVTWSEGRAELLVTNAATEGVWLTVTSRALLGPLRHAWRDEAVWIDPESSQAVPLDLPAGAWMHPTAATYVTTLSATAWVGAAAEGPARELPLPVRWLLWPRGPDDPPEVMSSEDLATRAPCGTTEQVADMPGFEGSRCRALPPIEDDRPGEARSRERERTTTPADDQRDEVAR